MFKKMLAIFGFYAAKDVMKQASEYKRVIKQSKEVAIKYADAKKSMDASMKKMQDFVEAAKKELGEV